MNADLEETLRELGPDYREFAIRMRSCAGDCSARASGAAPRPRRGFSGYAIAASLVLALAVTAVFVSPTASHSSSPASSSRPATPNSPYVLAYGGEATADEIIRTQRSDGSWDNDFLTCQNAAALRGIGRASVAYRKALRYLRARGLSPLSDAELRSRAQLAQCNRE